MKSTIRRNATKKRRRTNPLQPLNSDLIFKLSELLQGERGMIKVHSDTFDSDICFVNPAVCDPATLQIDCPVYTTRELAHVLSLSPEEFRQSHGLKVKSVA
jgi:hypothetical protein